MATKCNCQTKNEHGVLPGCQNCTDGNVCRDLYEACKTISSFYSDTGYKNVMPSMVEAVRKINRAITRAEGNSQH